VKGAGEGGLIATAGVVANAVASHARRNAVIACSQSRGRSLAQVSAGTPYGQKTKTAAKMAVVQASTMKQLSAPFPTAPHGSA